jgi:hypothetical protein
MLILRIIIALFIFSNLSYANDNALVNEKKAKAAIKELAISLKKSLKDGFARIRPNCSSRILQYCSFRYYRWHIFK